ncbi:MAG: hypothetical protein ABW168_22965 [Sedimenticola sp.]
MQCQIAYLLSLKRQIMKTILGSFIVIVTLAWDWEMLSPDHLTAGSLPWVIYQDVVDPAPEFATASE